MNSAAVLTPASVSQKIQTAVRYLYIYFYFNRSRKKYKCCTAKSISYICPIGNFWKKKRGMAIFTT